MGISDFGISIYGFMIIVQNFRSFGFQFYWNLYPNRIVLDLLIFTNVNYRGNLENPCNPGSDKIKTAILLPPYGSGLT